MILLWIRRELRRSRGLLASPILIALSVTALFVRGTGWRGVWPETSAAAGLAGAFLSPVAAALMAWMAIRWLPLDAPNIARTSSRSALVANTPNVIAGWLWCMSGYVVTVVVAMIATVTAPGGASPGFIWWGYIALGASTLTMWASFGHILGTLWPAPTVAPTVAAVVALLAQAVLRLPLSGPVSSDPSLPAVAWRVLLGVTALMLAMSVRPRNQGGVGVWESRRTRPLAPLTILLIGALAGSVMSGPLVRPRVQGSVQARCAGHPVVCVWPEHAALLPALTAGVRRLASTGVTQLHLPTAFYEVGLTAPAKAARFDPTDMWFGFEDITTQVLATSFPTPCQTHSKAQMGTQIHAFYELGQWLLRVAANEPQPSDIQGGPPGVDPAQMDALLRLSAAKQQEWAETRIRTATVETCR